MLARLTYMQKLARDLHKACHDRLKLRSSAEERDRDRKLWSLTKGLLTEFPADDQTTITDAWLVEVGATTCSTHGYRFDNLYIEAKSIEDDSPRHVLLALGLDQTHALKPIRVRGDFRRLLTTLNIEAKNFPSRTLVAA